MVTYNTQNPIGSADPRDLYDNAQVIDDYANSEAATTTDRLGRERRTLAGMDSEFSDAQYQRADEFDTAQAGRQAQFVQLMISGGYEFLGDYEAGIEFTSYKQIVRDGGEFWRPAAGTTLPYTTTGAGMPEGGAFVNIGDGLLRQDLVQPVATFNNAQDMKDASGLDVGRKVRTLGYYAPGDGGGNDYEIVADGTGSSYGFIYEQLTASGNEAKLLGGGIMEDKIAYIPTDYATLQEAIDDLKTIKSNGNKIVIVIESLHEITKGLLLEDGDYGHFSIESRDSEVNLSTTFSSPPPPTSAPGAVDTLFFASNCKFPEINTVFNMGGLYGSGVYLTLHSYVKVGLNCGVKNAGYWGLYVADRSSALANQSIFTGASAGSRVTVNSFLSAARADFSGAGNAFPSTAALDVSRGSVVYITGSPSLRTNLTNSVNRGLAVRRSFVSAAYIDVSGCDQGYRLENGATVDAYFGIMNNIGTIGILCDKSQLTANNMSISNVSGPVLQAQNASTVSFGRGTIDTCSGDAIYALRGSTVDAFETTIGNAGSNGVRCDHSSNINAERAEITGSGGRAIRCQNGSKVNARGATLTGSALGDIFIEEGSFVNAVAAVTSNGGTGLSLTDTNVASLNSIDGRKGVVWR